MEKWLEYAKNAVAADAAVAYMMCVETAEKQKVCLDWVIDQFKKEFERRTKDGQE